MTHPEFYYGFVGLALLWQGVFVLVARDPSRFRPTMPLAILEKLAYSVPVVILYSLGKVHPTIAVPALLDPAFAVLFIAAYLRTRPRSPPAEAARPSH